MSNRYVWNIYSLDFTEELDGPQNYSMTASFLGVDEPVFVRQAADAHISWSLQDPTVGNYNLLTGGDEYTEEATISIEPNYYYQLAYNSGRTSCYKAGSNGATAHLSFRSSGSNRRSCTLAADNVYYPLPRRSKGTANGTVSNSGASTYPQDGISGNYWYTYQGQDVIDAEAVGYSNQAPMGGQPITINVTPTTPTYGGTIRYTYQVKRSGGEWTTISSNNTATSLQYTIPAGTTSFAARVRASDTWGFSSSDYTTGTTLTVTNNLPPSAPDGITIGDVLGGQQCTITWGAATDSDGTIDHYELERQVDNGDTWTQIFSGNALTYSDTINSEWATVNYRVRAVDDDAEPGPYTTGTMKTVNAGWLYFSGPAADMGDKPAPFDFVFSIGSTTPDVTDISVEVLLDDEIVYTGTPDAAEQVSVHIDTRLMFAGEHVLVITAEKQNLLGLDQECTFTVPAVTLPDGGRMVQLYNDEGQAVFPLTLGRAVIGKGGEDINEILDRVFSGTYTGTGTSGSGNPCQLRLSFVPRFMFVYSNGATPASGWWIRTAEPTVEAQGTMETTGGTATVTWDNDNMTLSWYAASAAVQLNASGTAYGYMIIG